ncbi:PH domain-containing protein [Flavobacterium paronense]|uniref:PH domain-containing protein n=1 Tax=Flavobacterium paronense TaxID=1392775 RepID=A0ABV5GDT6_9FLAO|nr:PH domain-containing protein [Flavobacterium paronense]MDN3676362.1 PH domain-containing protein [Flavobacterium paronense]
MKIYKSKIDWWLGLVLVYPIFRSIASIMEGEWIGYLGIVLCLLFIVFISKSTRYIIADNQLIVKCLFIVNDTIEISKIRKIEKTNSVLSSPALSLDRIAIKFNKYDEVYISPKDRQAFIDDLLKINPEIESAI